MSDRCYRSELIGLFGYPVDENPTVVIMEAAFKALNLDYRYNTTSVKPEDLDTAVKALKAFNMKGTHITVPHKIEVMKYLDHIADDAQMIGAVNTVYLKDGETYGENTDGKGFIISLKEGNIDIIGKHVVILGAGGAAHAIAIELALHGVESIIIVNRNESKGRELTSRLNTYSKVKTEFVLWDKIFSIPSDTDLIVNATSVGLYPDKSKPSIDYNTLDKSMIVCDIIPNPPQTPFLDEAIKAGCHTFDGFSMLINQAAISFKLWVGEDAPIQAMREALKKEFDN
ncbi:MAG: shikimate dehydrogenase [Vallitaleaceae bacterium]|jgi:shikimate dehydrogenase|nr:shikimate dehydrogenase [Vallitaleaceae bacterium]